jgi:hypothetical protein
MCMIANQGSRWVNLYSDYKVQEICVDYLFVEIYEKGETETEREIMSLAGFKWDILQASIIVSVAFIFIEMFLNKYE